MTPTFTCWEPAEPSTVVPEFELDAEVLAAKQRDRLLEIVARWRCHPDLIALNRRLHFLELRLLDRRRHFLGGIAVEGHLERDLAANGVATGGLDLARIEIFYGHVAPNQLRLKHIPQRFHLVVVLGGQRDLAADAIELDRRGRALEVVALGDLFLRLVDGVVDFLEVDASGDIERSLLGHARNLTR